MESTTSKELHSKILFQENQKSKKKRVSFSIFNANTLEEMEKLRKTKEKEFLQMIDAKNKKNNKIGMNEISSSHVSFLKKQNSEGNNDSCSRKILVEEFIKKERFSKTTNPVEIVKVENIFLNNQSIYNLDKSSKDNIEREVFKIENNIENTIKGNVINVNSLSNMAVDNSNSNSNFNSNSNCNNLNTLNSLSIKSPKENILFSHSNLELSQVKERTERENNEILNNEENIQLNDKSEQNQEQLSGLPHSEQNLSDNVFTIYNLADVLVKNIGEKFEQKKIHFREYLKNFIENLKLKIIHLDDQYLDCQLWDENKIKFFKIKKIYQLFKDKIKNQIIKGKYETYNICQCGKFIKYRQHKIKAKLFDNLRLYMQKRKEWMQKIRRELKINTIW